MNMLTAIEIENFKGIREPVRLELRPITLLFGQNSAGKSSLLHALIYAREVFERHNLDAERTLSAADCLDLGGFRSLVHGHDERLAIRLRFDLDLQGIDLPGGWDPVLDSGNTGAEFEVLSAQVRTVRVGVAIAWSDLDQRAFVTEYEVELNGRRFARVVCDAPGKTVRIAEVDELHPVFNFPVDPVSSESWYFHQLIDDVRTLLIPTGEAGAIGLLNLLDALPAGRFVAGGWLSVAANQSLACDEHEAVASRRLSELERVLYQLLVGPVVLLRDLLGQFRYLGPLRQVPPRDYVPVQLEEPWRWANGLAGWDLLHARPALVARVSRLLSDSDRMNLGYELELVEYREFNARDPILTALQAERLGDIENVEAWLRRAKVRHRLLFRPLESPGVYLEPADLGVGVSQMIPVVAAALDDAPLGTSTLPVQLVVLEHPELNLHPRLQAELGDVLIEGVLSEATGGRTFIVETHSEPLTLRLFRCVRESTRGQPRFGIAVKPTDVGVWYVDRSAGTVVVKQVLIDVQGEFVQPWPEEDSLFEQAFRERYT